LKPIKNQISRHKDGKEIKASGNFKTFKDEQSGVVKLIVTNVGQQEEGTYRCTLSNANGTASAKASVSVESVNVSNFP